MLMLTTMNVVGQNRVYLEHSETLSFDENRLPDAQILKGDVRFRHEDAEMFCDSAYFFERSNSVTAFGHVRFEQGDTLHGYGDILYYDGNTRLARLCRNVRLVHVTTTLTTDSLNYNRNTDKAYYFTGGKIQDSLNVLTSRWGEYCPTTHDAIFKQDVVLGNESFTLETERLKYNTESKMAQLVVPTTIVYEGETTIRSSNGWYNTDTQQSMLLDRSVIEHEGGKFLTGDTIYYDKKLGYGQLLSRMETRDTVQKLTLTGNYGEVWEKEKRGLVTDSAMLEDWSQPNHTYMHADTLYTEELHFRDTIENKDTLYRHLRAYHHVRVYSDEYQVVCDSLTYDGKDSIIVLHHQPICWNEKNQISADSITLYLVDGKLDHVHGVGMAMGVMQEIGDYYNQLVGKEMFAYMRDGELKQVDVVGNAETIFYPKDDDDYIGVNKTQSSYVQIFLEEQKIHHVLFTTKTNGTMYPMGQIDKKDTFFPIFFWAEQERPLSKDDIFLKPQRTARPERAIISATEEDETETEIVDLKTKKSKPSKKRKGI